MSQNETPVAADGRGGARTILLVDNDPDFMSTCAEFLAGCGYRVRQAHTFDEALAVVEREWVHLVIIDLRLRDDSDQYDDSGVTLAKRITPAIPKIILTIDKNYRRVREVLSTSEGKSPPALYYLNKEEGQDVLLEHVRSAFELHVRFESVPRNMDLRIEWGDPDSYGLARHIEPGVEGETLDARAAEIENLLCLLFCNEKELKVRQMLWRREGRVAFYVNTSGEEDVRSAQVVVCGRLGLVCDERRRFRKYAPREHGEAATTLSGTAETANFAANAYSLSGAQAQGLQTLFDAYRISPERFAAALKLLCERTLPDWSRLNRLLPEESRTLDQLYRSRLALPPSPRADFEVKLEALISRLPSLGLEVERRDGHITFKFDEQSHTYPDPSGVIYRTFERPPRLTLTCTPGALAGETVLTDGVRRTWVTDFSRAGLAPPFWDCVELEAAIRFDWGEAAGPQLIHELERSLTSERFTRMPADDVEPRLKKRLKAIEKVRHYALPLVGKEPHAYHLALLFHAASRLSGLERVSRLMPEELVGPAHWLMAAAMLCRLLPAGAEAAPPQAAVMERGISFDAATGVARVNGVDVKLPKKPAKIFAYLYGRPNQTCTRQEIVEEALRESYDADDKHQDYRLNMAIHRLREKIEEFPEEHKFVKTVQQIGFRFVPEPDEGGADG